MAIMQLNRMSNTEFKQVLSFSEVGTSKIYHVPGGAFYNKVTPEQCFKTEAEAKAAGWDGKLRLLFQSSAQNVGITVQTLLQQVGIDASK